MGIRSGIVNALLKSDRVVTDCSSQEEIAATLRLLRPALTGLDFVRIGGFGDGGYLVPNDLAGIKYCFSPGVSEVADFEEQLASDFGIYSFLADASVDAPPADNSFFDFEKKFLGCRDQAEFMKLSTWMEKKIPAGDAGDLILQMDIEGSEYDVFIDSSIETLRRFRIMVVEFHGMDMMFQAKSLKFLKAIFEKLAGEFVVAHIHPNNCKTAVQRFGISVPPVMEVTFLRKDRVKPVRDGDVLLFPHELDRKNVPSKEDVILPDIWWKQVP
ncbi:FkbM family methyltransferase [Rhizobium sullae]|uniref:Methyltransferase FkbM domain-containing protein n=1 Tax=Rhizobium sullae TaxID=50338 RepID=A0A2N0D125_RHISU|nr:FkbM family methyltransferase [Rhizobium sullae]PKA39748.1 hypothetical protein CWR43_31325 [Rhizobium sullae]